MPWKVTEPMCERAKFVTLHEQDLFSMSELCQRFGISRRTGYKWLAEASPQTYSYTAEIGRDGTVYLPDAFYTVTGIAWQPVKGTPATWEVETHYTFRRLGTNGPIIGFDTIYQSRLPLGFYENDALRVTGRRGRGIEMPTEGWLAMIYCAAIKVYDQVREDRMRGMHTISLGDGMSGTFAGGETIQLPAAFTPARWKAHADRWINSNRRIGAA